MKRILLSVMLVLVAADASALQRKPIQEVEKDAFIRDTQVAPSGAGDDHLALVWWVPYEFWQATAARDATTSEADKKAMLDALRPVSVLAVVQGDISPFGALRFYSKDEVERNMVIAVCDAGGKEQRVQPLQTIDPDLQILLGALKPALSAAVGNLGRNMHFFVLSDRVAEGARLFDPYRKGVIKVQLAKRNGKGMTAEIETPLNPLFVPRKCPNGKDAHVSWDYCPWTGKRLEE